MAPLKASRLWMGRRARELYGGMARSPPSGGAGAGWGAAPGRARGLGAGCAACRAPWGDPRDPELRLRPGLTGPGPRQRLGMQTWDSLEAPSLTCHPHSPLMGRYPGLWPCPSFCPEAPASTSRTPLSKSATVCGWSSHTPARDSNALLGTHRLRQATPSQGSLHVFWHQKRPMQA